LKNGVFLGNISNPEVADPTPLEQQKSDPTQVKKFLSRTITNFKPFLR